MDIRKRVTDTYMNYEEKIRKAHTKIIQLEKSYKSRTRKEDDIIIENILTIIEEATDDN